jgi:hypothetical protein
MLITALFTRTKKVETKKFISCGRSKQNVLTCLLSSFLLYSIYVKYVLYAYVLYNIYIYYNIYLHIQ